MGRITEDLIIPDTHQCIIGGNVPLTAETWLLNTAWEVLTLSLALWSAVKHFRELQQPWARWTIGDCFTVLIKSHVLYFVRLAHILNGLSSFAAEVVHVLAFLLCLASNLVICPQTFWYADLSLIYVRPLFIILIGLNYRGH
jgi:hypothetical protein